MSIDFSDQDLVSRVRHGDTAAFGDLYAHHSAAAHRAARRISRDPHVAEDVVSEAFARVFKALQAGQGPTGDLFPYLLVTMRNVAASWGRESVRWTPVGDDTAFAPRDARDSVAGADELPVDRLNMSLTSAAFETLPRRWRTVLWYLEVEGESAADVGQRLGLSDVAVRQLARRAREGLREAYLAAYLGGEPAIGDHVPSADLVSMARGKLSLRRRASVEKHLDTCPRCSGLLFEAAEENSTLRALALPFYIAAVFALVRWGQALGARLPRLPGRTLSHQPVAQAAMAAAAIVAVVSGSLAVTPSFGARHGTQAAGAITSTASSGPTAPSSARSSTPTTTPTTAPTSAPTNTPTTTPSTSAPAATAQPTVSVPQTIPSALPIPTVGLTALPSQVTQSALPTVIFPTNPIVATPTGAAGTTPTPAPTVATTTPTTASTATTAPTTTPTTAPTTTPTTTPPTTTPTTTPPPPPPLTWSTVPLSPDPIDSANTDFVFFVHTNASTVEIPIATITLPAGVVSAKTYSNCTTVGQVMTCVLAAINPGDPDAQHTVELVGSVTEPPTLTVVPQ